MYIKRARKSRKTIVSTGFLIIGDYFSEECYVIALTGGLIGIVEAGRDEGSDCFSVSMKNYQ